MKNLEDIYRYVPFIYQCHRCGQHYPIWMVSDRDWKKGVKKMAAGFGPAKKICKQCFEEFNESPKYLTIDEYLANQAVISADLAEIMKTPQFFYEVSSEGIAQKRETVTALWGLPPQYTEEEREEAITEIGWRRGPYYMAKKASSGVLDGIRTCADIYECDICKAVYRWWMIDDALWLRSGFAPDAYVCKKCFKDQMPDVVFHPDKRSNRPISARQVARVHYDKQLDERAKLEKLSTTTPRRQE